MGKGGAKRHPELNPETFKHVTVSKETTDTNTDINRDDTDGFRVQLSKKEAKAAARAARKAETNRAAAGQPEAGESVERDGTTVRDRPATAAAGPSTGSDNHEDRRQTSPPTPQAPPAANSTSVREPTVVIKLEGEDRPFPSAAEVLQGVLGITSSESTAISGMVRTGACYHEVWTQKDQQAVRLVEILDGKTILRWSSVKLGSGTRYTIRNRIRS